ncbi:MAG: DUF3149 domain-containing protein [Pseudomonadota bacterium]|jgi:hypothetical protein|nr:DUF3149 domain-containing protein [Gammaproteobacteria bacterium]MBU1731412.1 DUF3149 domain-containing protein [Gammaproteobacteria bacterium]MBU1892917.1 DUF3149 domain-containing protein [Gammaproteobacteria bacterium]
MGIMEMLFATDIGLLSMFTIGFILAMAVFFIIWYNKKINEPNQGE